MNTDRPLYRALDELHTISQLLGGALNLPRYSDDPITFPDAKRNSGDDVRTGTHSALSLAMDAAKRLEARLNTWQPIATVPVNLAVLVYVPNAEHYGPGIYRAVQCDMGTGRRWLSTGWSCGRDFGADAQPTHWMPLPEVPLQLGQTNP